MYLLISAPSLGVGVYYFFVVDSVCLYVCLSVCLSLCSFKLLILFCFSMESSHFLAISSPWPLYKTLFFDIWFRPPNAQNLLPQISTKSPISRHWQIDRRCVGLLGGFRDGRFNGTMQNVVGPTLVALATIFGLGAEIQTPTGLFTCLLLAHNRHLAATGSRLL